MPPDFSEISYPSQARIGASIQVGTPIQIFEAGVSAWSRRTNRAPGDRGGFVDETTDAIVYTFGKTIEVRVVLANCWGISETPCLVSDSLLVLWTPISRPLRLIPERHSLWFPV